MTFEGNSLPYVSIHGYKSKVYSIHTWGRVNLKLKGSIQEVGIIEKRKEMAKHQDYSTLSNKARDENLKHTKRGG